jgi:alkanesulfonate monooxygenase SsuD/methylene tetrahydromethanopterin reductase-like flavin-dependent oxidoreductase (luciferase family)
MSKTIGTAADAGSAASLVIGGPSALKMAPFGVNMQRGVTPTLGEGSIAELDWAQQVRIARAAEAAGMEGIIAGARWRGYRGPSNWCHESYEGLPWAAGIGAATERLSIFSTIHVPLLHPVRAAKTIATADHVAGGRYALNIVAGWNVDEFAMFGMTQNEHDDRYAQAAEWATIVKRLWAEAEPFDFEGRYYTVRGGISAPHPVQQPRPPVMSAGASPAGRQFAATHADICFVSAIDMAGLKSAADDIRGRAAALGRTVQIWSTTAMLCGETEADVKRQYDYFVHETGDWEAAEVAIRENMAGGSKTIDRPITPDMIETRLSGAFGPRLFGTPEQIVETMGEFVDVGIDGIATIWFDYERGIDAYRDLVLPLAADAGLRAPAADRPRPVEGP